MPRLLNGPVSLFPQALALAAANTRLEADTETTSRIKESERRLLARIQSTSNVVPFKGYRTSGVTSCISAPLRYTAPYAAPVA